VDRSCTPERLWQDRAFRRNSGASEAPLHLADPGGAAAPRTGAHSSLGRHLIEGPAATVAKELIPAVARDVDIQVAVVVIVAYGHAGTLTAFSESPTILERYTVRGGLTRTPDFARYPPAWPFANQLVSADFPRFGLFHGRSRAKWLDAELWIDLTRKV
jgi:hypothetical protein